VVEGSALIDLYARADEPEEGLLAKVEKHAREMKDAARAVR
jgi:hypothetical protein